MQVAIIRFPGSNCDLDTEYAFKSVVGVGATLVWHHENGLPESTTAVVIPGGFSYGDYLRSGAMAAHSSIMAAVKRFANNGGPVLGICNGFQILCESHLLPGALLPNLSGNFVCKDVKLEVCANAYKFGLLKGETLTLPIAHHEGRYHLPEQALHEVQASGCIALKYENVDDAGRAECNGSLNAIAGILGGPQKNILGLMPHPERACESCLGNDSGLAILKAMVG